MYAADDTYCKAPTQFEYVEESGFEAGASPGMDATAAQLNADGDGIPDYLKAKPIIIPQDPDPLLVAAQIITEVVGSRWPRPKCRFWCLARGEHRVEPRQQRIL